VWWDPSRQESAEIFGDEFYVASGCRAGWRRNVGAGLPFSRLLSDAHRRGARDTPSAFPETQVRSGYVWLVTGKIQ
jgi:hypothetical protein